jgi:hypothetical protein
MENIPITYMEDSINVTDSGLPKFDIELPLGYMYKGERLKCVTYRLTNGVDMERISSLQTKNQAEINAQLMKLMIISISDGGSNEITSVSPEMISSLSLKDIKYFFDSVNNNTPGPDFSIKDLSCAGCGMDLKISIPINAFLLD